MAFSLDAVDSEVGSRRLCSVSFDATVAAEDDDVVTIAAKDDVAAVVAKDDDVAAVAKGDVAVMFVVGVFCLLLLLARCPAEAEACKGLFDFA